MKKTIYLLVVFFVVISCKTEERKTVKKATALKVNTKVATYNYKGLEPLLSKKDDKIYVVNFWATWCAPCVKELPAFEKLLANYKDKNVEVILVSLDFPDQVEERLIPFLEKKKLKAKVVLLDDSDENTWIPKIDKNWTGAIPATLIYNKNQKRFYEQSFHYEQLEKELNQFLK